MSSATSTGLGPSTTKKQADFETKPLRNDDRTFKPITALPGIGAESAKILAKTGYTTIEHIIGQFMLFSGDKELMAAFLEDKIPSLQERHINNACDALSQWRENHL